MAEKEFYERFEEFQKKEMLVNGVKIFDTFAEATNHVANFRAFADTLNAVVAKVNETQEQEDVVTEAYERGETTDIATVALIQSRASITFEATLQVRNKLLSAYRDIMNMPIG